MKNKINIIDAKALTEKGLSNFLNKKHKFGSIEAKYLELEPHEVPPPEGYKQKKGYPNCCEFHKSITKNTKEDFENFPNCCKYHKPLNNAKWFNKEKYKIAFSSIVDKVVYTEHIIETSIEKESWYEEITDYIEYIVFSLGQFPTGHGNPAGLRHYMAALKNYVTNTKIKIPHTKRKLLISYVDEQYSGKNEKDNPQTDLNILNQTYEKWLKAFPLELSYFKHLKEYFTKNLPFLKKIERTNKYTGMAKAIPHTRDSLVNYLIERTNQLLVKLNGLALYEQGLLSEVKAKELEMAIEKRRQELKILESKDPNDEEIKYRKILKEWLKGEQEFLKAISPYVKDVSENILTKTHSLNAELRKYGFFELEKVKAIGVDNQQKMIELLVSNKLPYCVAMFDYLGFIKYLKKEHFPTANKLNIAIATWLGVGGKDGRDVKGNLSSLTKNDTSGRYKAHLHKENVEKDYQLLK